MKITNELQEIWEETAKETDMTAEEVAEVSELTKALDTIDFLFKEKKYCTITLTDTHAERQVLTFVKIDTINRFTYSTDDSINFYFDKADIITETLEKDDISEISITSYEVPDDTIYVVKIVADFVTYTVQLYDIDEYIL